ncbi:cob(I)alamin adenosyltransferase [Endomicrobiia bacterium]|uniref:cob(I)yrinic acid a,c-diamide adenosyltransferase n=1 Tax=Endomicrobium trichonymphae TaxID=1408204 RepID=UPI000864C864|nr:cob(I)yrinic acid a,c-diamide adenosyltransferase [Candidatus Endomicrobium trichonymphae]GHT04038.1 cob(I)alamin adenosyltransferase [Endomicrobiia bacterium]BAV58995.1 cob(I)alamin adenosyltransferase [Candidatus Endomicrobium trichonymphae]GHT09189.1 cob(I)alamin adenosyltransferase [Endomicrobiia bacterium]GHT11007.1 cob(I)alamin adenosyltransferase [Endomicrobiia bacterium]GHT16005.1 cob(I)alamin adenosyltransferase [Endomicrobiia bacterium]
MIILNTGNGKGKTTSAVGQIIRSLGYEFRVCLIQLFKGENFYGEQKILVKLDNLDFFPFAKEHPDCIKGVNLDKVVSQCRSAVKKLRDLADVPEKYDLIVLEEFNIALRDKFIDENEFIDIIKRLSQKSNVIVTGRGAPQSLIDIADLVTEMKEIKHPYKKGVQSQRGIEY